MTLNMNARKDSVARIKPILARKTQMTNGIHYWWISIPYGDDITLLFPCDMYTHEKAVQAFCDVKGIDRQDVIVKVEEE